MTALGNALRNTRRISDLSAGRDNNFDLIRMLAATGVMVSHAFPITLGDGTPEPFETFLKGDNLGRACVFAFFSISGFYITRSFLMKRDTRAFLTARFLRLYPGLVVMFLLTVLAAGVWLSTDPQVWQAAPRYVLTGLSLVGYYPLPGMFPDNPVPEAVNGSLWTLQYEVMCYLGVLALGLLGVFDRKRLFVAIAALFVASYYVGPMLTGRLQVVYLLYLGMPFLVGVCFCLWQDRIPLSPVIAVALAALVVVLRPTPLFLPAFNLALAYVVFLLGFAQTPRLRAYNRLGDYSYGMYIYAFPVQQTMAQLGFLTPMSNLALAFPVTLVFAVASWHLIEGPALRLRHHRLFSASYKNTREGAGDLR